MRASRFLLRFLLLLGVLLASVAGAAERKPPRVDPAAEAARIRETDAAWLAAVKARDVERAVAFWSDDATIIPPGEAPITGKAAIRKYVTDSFATPGFSITWKLEEVEVSAAGDMAYSVETNRVTLRNPDGTMVELNGRGVAVWKKQPHGAWKCVVDIWTPAPK